MKHTALLIIILIALVIIALPIAFLPGDEPGQLLRISGAEPGQQAIEFELFEAEVLEVISSDEARLRVIGVEKIYGVEEINGGECISEGDEITAKFPLSLGEYTFKYEGATDLSSYDPLDQYRSISDPSSVILENGMKIVVVRESLAEVDEEYVSAVEEGMLLLLLAESPCEELRAYTLYVVG